MCRGIEAIGRMLLTCIYDPKTQNLCASSGSALLASSLLSCWTIWLAYWLSRSDLLHEKSVLRTQRAALPWYREQTNCCFLWRLLPAQNICKFIQEDGFPWSGHWLLSCKNGTWLGLSWLCWRSGRTWQVHFLQRHHFDCEFFKNDNAKLRMNEKGRGIVWDGWSIPAELVNRLLPAGSCHSRTLHGAKKR